MSESTCCTCGYTWPTGQHGGHSCTQVLQSRIDAAEALAEVESTGADKAAKAMLYWKRDADALRQQLAERDAVLRDAARWMRGVSGHYGAQNTFADRIEAMLSSAEPVSKINADNARYNETLRRVELAISNTAPLKCMTPGCIDGTPVPGWSHCKRHQFYELKEPAKGGDGEVTVADHTEELLPCPCCGGTDLDHAADPGTQRGNDYIMCSGDQGCGLMISRIDSPNGDIVAAWNQRATPQPGPDVRALVEAVELHIATISDRLADNEAIRTSRISMSKALDRYRQAQQGEQHDA